MECVMSTTVRFNGFSAGVTSVMTQGMVEVALQGEGGVEGGEKGVGVTGKV